MVAPGHCSPSRNVVSKITTRSRSERPSGLALSLIGLHLVGPQASGSSLARLASLIEFRGFFLISPERLARPSSLRLRVFRGDEGGARTSAGKRKLTRTRQFSPRFARKTLASITCRFGQKHSWLLPPGARPSDFRQMGGTGGAGWITDRSNSLMPDQRIRMPRQNRIKAESRTATSVPPGPSRRWTRSA